MKIKLSILFMIALALNFSQGAWSAGTNPQESKLQLLADPPFSDIQVRDADGKLKSLENVYPHLQRNQNLLPVVDRVEFYGTLANGFLAIGFASTVTGLYTQPPEIRNSLVGVGIGTFVGAATAMILRRASINELLRKYNFSIEVGL